MKSSFKNLKSKYTSVERENNNIFQPLGENEVRIVFNCYEGSVSHYFHFFYGALIPLIEYHLNNPDKKLLITTNIGPFKKIFDELFPSDVIIGYENPVIPPNSSYFDDKSMNYVRIKAPDEVILPAYDVFNNKFIRRYSNVREDLNRIKNRILNFIEDRMPEKYLNNPDYRKVILIGRDVDEYYIQKRMENRQAGIESDREIFYTSGRERRDIQNFRELSNSLSRLFRNDFSEVLLENTSIFYQYQLFKNAGTIIAQHGASLSNLFFCKENTNVLEVMSPWGVSGNHFSNLSYFCNLNYNSVTMDSDIGNVNVNEIVNLLSSISRERRRSKSPPSASRTTRRNRSRSKSRSPPSSRTTRRNRSRSRSPQTKKYNNSRNRSRSRSPNRSYNRSSNYSSSDRDNWRR